MAQWTERWTAKKRVTGWIPVRAQAWVVGQIPSRGHRRGNHTLIFLSLSPSLPLSLKINKIFFKKDTEKKIEKRNKERKRKIS